MGAQEVGSNARCIKDLEISGTDFDCGVDEGNGRLTPSPLLAKHARKTRQEAQRLRQKYTRKALREV